MRIKKKNTRGNARNFITRSQAVRKLQVSLADFRRLCIFKGIYPREPRNKKKANKGSTAPTTFYYAKDIQYLMHEPVLAKFREHKTFARKLTRALGRGEVSSAKRLEENRDSYTLDHIIKERYPSFPDAIRDIDDALNMLFLFSNLPSTNQVSSKIINDAQKICNQWLAYVAKERLVRKVFVSIKGVYYQANIKGEEVRWLVPFKFPENIPSDVDFRIMLTFLEFYSTLLHFVLYKLYTDSGLIYPPKLDLKKDKIISGLSSYILESRQEDSLLKLDPTEIEEDVKVESLDASTLKSALNADEANTDETEKEEEQEKKQEKEQEKEQNEETELDTFEDNNKNKGDILIQPSKYDSPVASLFSAFVFYVSREVPIDILEFLILSCGGNVISEASMDQIENKKDIDMSKVTHQIVDRPVLKNKVAGRTYIQPQWIFDCINKGELVPANKYLPGEALPPHLSPWGDAIGYDPTAPVEEGEEEESESESESEDQVEEEDQEVVAGEEDDDDDEELQAQKELELEAQGIKYSETSEADKDVNKSKNKKRKVDEEEEEKKLKMIMMSNKQKKLYKKMKYSNAKKEEQAENLKKKKKQIAKQKAKLNKLDSKK
ncbi:CPS_HP_G0088500.mRNA.1.CDS.1 [Saccharomyces cerevisiae]|nr:CPS_HP_G0019040.mRNA.1.CDS.1 [Saccharomyces cerevisiae]CAI5015897.1 CPS_HP_G0088500.mRNA.1.CDS.1 [Saccharomyces cerevisiae]CAI6433241.1 CPS_HP_G0019040.mRNA.1.CDS.1 [Saccharomyces cerevisiae]CAI6933376.1 CPS_HP_G0088500.mRNA.1.CDS.1 [Saccharomyces cerevisiae]